MANKKFSEFELKTTTSNVSHIVGYNGAENVRITPANFISGSGGPFLPLTGGNMTGNTTHNDNVRAQFGASSDLQIYHDSNVSYIRDDGDGGFFFTTNGDAMHFQDNSGEYMAKFVKDAAVELYYDNTKKFETLSTGANVSSSDDTSVVLQVGASTSATDKEGSVELYRSDSSSNRTLAGQFKTGIPISGIRGIELISFQAMGFETQTGSGHFVWKNSTEKMRLDSSGKLGIGTSSPLANLDIGNDSGSIYQRWSYDNPGANNYFLSLSENVTAGNVRFCFNQKNAGTNYDNVLVFDQGNVGIGTTNPASKLNVLSTKTVALSTAADFLTLGLTVDDDTAYNTAGGGGGIAFRGKRNSSGVQTVYGAIDVLKENTDNDTFLGAMRFYTNQNSTGVPLERMRIDSAGNTIIQNPTGASQSSYGLRFNKTNSSSLQQVGSEILTVPYGNNTNAGDLIFKTASTSPGVLVERVRINGVGELRVVQSSIVVESAGEGIYLGGTAAGNLLNDYEEGTCTLRLTSDTAFDNETDVTCNYTKIGNLVTVFVSANIPGSPTGGSGNVKITGLPFTVASTNGFGAVRFGRVNLSASLSPFGGVLQAVQNSTDAIVIFPQNNALSSLLTAAQMNSSGTTPLIDGVLTYKV